MGTLLVSGPGLLLYRNIFVHGRLCRQHARFEHKCQECHVSWSGVTVKRCGGTCHAKLIVKGEEHPKLNISCLTCHQDHLGLNYDSTDLANKRCIECHRDLKLKGSVTGKILVLIDKETRQLNRLIEDNAASIMDSPICPHLHTRNDCACCHNFHIKESDEVEGDYDLYDMYPLEPD